jgi:hypothetical protein
MAIRDGKYNPPLGKKEKKLPLQRFPPALGVFTKKDNFNAA